MQSTGGKLRPDRFWRRVRPTNSRWVLGPRGVVLATGIVVAAMPGVVAAASPDSAIVQMVLDAIEANYGAIDSARLTYAEERRDAGVEEKTVTRLQNPGGGVAVVTRAPVVRARQEIWLAGDRLRVDHLPGDTGETERASFVVQDNRCTQYVDEHRAAWVRRLGEMPGMMPLDPRQYGMADIRRDLRRILQEEEIVAADIDRDERGEAVVRMVTQSRTGARTTYEFLESAGYLPTRLLTRWSDGSVRHVIDVEYQRVGAGSARMPKTLTQRFYAEGIAEAPGSDQWRQQMRREVVGQIVVNQEIPSEVFNLEMAEGIRVSDNIRRAVYHIESPLPARPNETGLLWATVAVTFALLLAVMYKHATSIRMKAV